MACPNPLGPKKIKNSIFEIPVTLQTPNINDQSKANQTEGAKASANPINLHVLQSPMQNPQSTRP